MNIITNYPIFSISLISAIIGGALVAIVRKWVSLHLLTSHHEVAFPIFLQIGVIYAVLLAFVCAMVLNDIADAYKDAKLETTNLLTLTQLAPGFSPEIREKIDATIIEYVKIIINDEWPKMAHGQESPNASIALSKLQHIYLNINPHSPREEALYAESLTHLVNLREGRRLRLFTAEEPRFSYQWSFLGILGMIVVAISYFFGMKHLWTQMILTGALVFTIASILAVILVLSRPFAGKFAITPRVFQNTLVRLEQISREEHDVPS